jgi:peptide-methionine (S)-S-oxide reductase
VFQEVEGVERVVSGYAGGRTPDPGYEEVCSGSTGHAEVVQVHFDPGRVPYRRLLEIFFAIHDPTTPDRQGADVGSQYRSIVLTHSAEQAATARAVVAELEAEGVFPAPIVTEVRPLETFWPAEAYHQDYYRGHTAQPYCQAVISPKLAKFRAKFLAPA